VCVRSKDEEAAANLGLNAHAFCRRRVSSLSFRAAISRDLRGIAPRACSPGGSRALAAFLKDLFRTARPPAFSRLHNIIKITNTTRTLPAFISGRNVNQFSKLITFPALAFALADNCIVFAVITFFFFGQQSSQLALVQATPIHVDRHNPCCIFADQIAKIVFWDRGWSICFK
jgi:hypothetical protein